MGGILCFTISFEKVYFSVGNFQKTLYICYVGLPDPKGKLPDYVTFVTLCAAFFLFA